MAINDNSNQIPNLELLSNIHMLGIYIIPVVLSICLFGYIFKKKTVDFVGSMPISRKSLFITNTIGGILIIILMNAVSVALLAILGCLFPNLFIPITMLVDYFLLWTISYIFVFTASNIAMSLAGNAITGIAVTMLILFLVPFLNSYYHVKQGLNSPSNYQIACENDACIPEHYACYNNSTQCLENKEKHIYRPYGSNIANINYASKSYTTPYNIIYNTLIGDSGISLYSLKQIVIMTILSIIYIIIGLSLFKRRQMEVSETSFGNMKMHLLVKNLTLIPILCLTYEIISESTWDISIIFVFGIIIVYYFIYDLITKKAINHIIKNLFSLAGMTITVFAILFISDKVIREQDTPILKSSSIKSVMIRSDLADGVYNYSDTLKNIKITNKDIIMETLKQITTDQSDSKRNSHYLKVTYQTNKGLYQYEGYINETAFLKLKTMLRQDNQIISSFNNIDYNKVFAIKLGSNLYDVKDKQELLTKIKTAMSKVTINTNIEPNDILTASLYSYQNHELVEYNINLAIDNDLLKMVASENNQETKKHINPHFRAHCEGKEELCQNSNFWEFASQDITKYIKEHNQNVDLTKDYIIINFYNYGKIDSSNYHYQYITNDIQELNTIVATKKDELRNNPDYDYLFEEEPTKDDSDE